MSEFHSFIPSGKIAKLADTKNYQYATDTVKDSGYDWSWPTYTDSNNSNGIECQSKYDVDFDYTQHPSRQTNHWNLLCIIGLILDQVYYKLGVSAIAMIVQDFVFMPLWIIILAAVFILSISIPPLRTIIKRKTTVIKLKETVLHVVRPLYHVIAEFNKLVFLCKLNFC